jgi:hypothetical protein
MSNIIGIFIELNSLLEVQNFTISSKLQLRNPLFFKGIAPQSGPKHEERAVLPVLVKFI